MQSIYEEEKSEISEQFIERMVEKIIDSLGTKFDMLGIALGDIDLSVDFLASLIADTDPAAIAGLQRRQHRMSRRGADGERRDDRMNINVKDA
jgi:hypothetical protein